MPTMASRGPRRDLPGQSIPRSKFGAPSVPARAVDRPRVLESLNDNEWRLAALTGGPGTGKTVGAAQWFARLGSVPREWITLDPQDDRPERFWLIVASALDRAVPGAFSESVNA